MLPFVVFSEGIQPLISSGLNNKLILVDFLFNSQSRGILYCENALSLLDGKCGFSCINEVSKEKDIVIQAIGLFCVHVKNFHYFHEKHEETGLDISGWVFVKRYDFNKLGQWITDKLDEFNIVVQDTSNDDWLVISNKSNSTSIPELGKNIIGLNDLNSFIFVIYKFNDCEPTEYSQLWDKYIS